MQNYVEMEGNFSLSMSYHYEYWLASYLDSHEQQSIQSLHGLSYSSVWLCYPRYLGITRRSCLEAHMVLDMEYREQERPEHGP
jgi:hypothetical protein